MENELKPNSDALGRPLRVLLADDDDLVRNLIPETLSAFQDIEVVSTAKNGHEVLELVNKYTVDVVLMDVDMPTVDGIEATTWLAREHPEIKVLVFTSFGRRPSVMEAIKAGAVGFITKDTPITEIVQDLRRVSRGESVLSQNPAEALMDIMRAQPLQTIYDETFIQSVNDLPKQLRKVYQLLIEGLSNKVIAKKLGLKENTVRDYVSQILARTNCESRSLLVVKSFENGSF